VLYDWQFKDGQRVNGGQPAGPKWLDAWLGPDYFDTVKRAEAGPTASDAELAHIGRLTRLEFLDLSDAPAVTEAGLAHLAGLTHLGELRLNRTPVTDAGLTRLKGLSQLRNLNVRGTKVTDSGAQDLRKSLPDLTISR
jgi:hypothetical protein